MLLNGTWGKLKSNVFIHCSHIFDLRSKCFTFIHWCLCCDHRSSLSHSHKTGQKMRTCPPLTVNSSHVLSIQTAILIDGQKFWRLKKSYMFRFYFSFSNTELKCSHYLADFDRLIKGEFLYHSIGKFLIACMKSMQYYVNSLIIMNYYSMLNILLTFNINVWRLVLGIRFDCHVDYKLLYFASRI